MRKEYFVTKLSFRKDIQLIDTVSAFAYDGNVTSEYDTYNRDWLVQKKSAGSKISIAKTDSTKFWQKGNEFTYSNNRFTWGEGLPMNLTRRKTFISYYHKDDQGYRNEFENRFGDLLISKSVEDGDIDPDNEPVYVRHLIQSDYLCDTTVLVVLLGAKTWCRKHVDWEIFGGLFHKVGDRHTALLGLLLPTHPDFGNPSMAASSLPKRFEANLKSGYAILKDWTEDRATLQKYIELAFSKRVEDNLIVNTAIIQQLRNLCD
jgi:hypothetical protein